MATSPKISPSERDGFWMRRALTVAARAAERGEVPIAALLVRGDELLGSAYNRRESTHDATAHAEVLAIRRACRKIGDWRLQDAELFITMEPCLMCFGAATQSRVARIVYACENPKNPPYLRQIYRDWPRAPRLQGGVEAPAAVKLLSGFFSALR